MCSQGISKLMQFVHWPFIRALSPVHISVLSRAFSAFRCIHFTLRLRQLSHACGSLLFLDPFTGGLLLSSDEDMLSVVC